MLIVFIDALPASKNFQIRDFKKSKLVPNLGYSVNLHNEIFNGKSPDQMGFFGEYLYNPNPSIIKKTFFSFLNILEYAPFKLSSLFKIFLRRFFNIRFGQIPFKLVPFFNRDGKYPFIGECDSILNKFQCFITDDLKNGLGNRDIVAIDNINSHLKNNSPNKNLFLSLCDLDGIGHKYGTNSDEYKNRLNFLEKHINKLTNDYSKQFPDESIIVLSDHGMSNVNGFIDARKVISEIKNEYNVKFFYDSLYMHVFVDNSTSKNNQLIEINKKLSSNLPLHCFSIEERIKYGVTNKKFGDLLFVINDKLAFSPNLFGFLKMKAYHGYLPLSEDNKGIFLHKNLKIDISNNEVSSLNANQIINDSL